jgi:hypothetical protein
MSDYPSPTEQEYPWNIHELYGMEILSNWDSWHIGFNPKIDDLLDLWFFHNGIVIIERRLE